MKFTITLKDGSKQSLVSKNNDKEPPILGKKVIIKKKSIIPSPQPVRKFFIRQVDGTKKNLIFS